MGCGQKAVADDEDDWYDFKHKVGLVDTPWKVYSREASAARLLHSKLKSKGLLLKLDVLQFLAQEDLLNLHAQERQAFIAAERVMKKYT